MLLRHSDEGDEMRTLLCPRVDEQTKLLPSKLILGVRLHDLFLRKYVRLQCLHAKRLEVRVLARLAFLAYVKLTVLHDSPIQPVVDGSGEVLSLHKAVEGPLTHWMTRNSSRYVSPWWRRRCSIRLV